jgi:hypothetical protein
MAQRPAKPAVKGPPGKPGRRLGSKTKVSHAEREALRHLGETLFCMDPDGISTNDLAAMPEFALVQPATIRTWAVEGNWLQKRRDVMRRWRRKVEDRLAEKIVKQRLGALDDMERLYKTTMSYVSAGDDGVIAVQPRSYEGTVATALKIEKHMAELRREMLTVAGSAVDGRGPERAAPQDNLPALTAADMQQMAHALMAAQHPEARRSAPEVVKAEDA